LGSRTRPTSERAREGIFSALDALGALEEARVLDLFSGSGALAIEALSRGASMALAVEAHAATCRLIRSNADRLGLSSRLQVLCCDLARPSAYAKISALDCAYDLVLADPPYALAELLCSMQTQLHQRELLKEGAILALEHPRKHPIMVEDAYELLRSYRYGDAGMSVLSFRDKGEGRDE